MIYGQAEYTYATCFDTRTYSCVLSKLQRKSKTDSVEMMRVLREWTGCQCDLPASFPSTKSSAENYQSWIYKRDGQVMMSKCVSGNLARMDK